MLCDSMLCQFSDPETWTTTHVEKWIKWLMVHYNIGDEILVSTYSQYCGREILKMGRRLFRDISSSHYNVLGTFWDHLMFLCQGNNVKVKSTVVGNSLLRSFGFSGSLF